ncbi:MAG: 3-phosphoshikimate 1-carboxyvinyltransferase [Mucinivorans sp.]
MSIALLEKKHTTIYTKVMVNAPASKSYAQRAIAAALLASGRSVLFGVDPSDDTLAALDVARRLGAKISNEGSTYYIDGGFDPQSNEISIGESGLSTRLFTPIAALARQPITITGHSSILRRPMDMMIEPLQSLGVQVDSHNGFLPLTVHGPMLGAQGVRVDGSISSQFLTGLLTALPLVDGDTTLLVNDLQSRPYIDITLDVLHQFGIKISHEAYKTFHIAGNQRYTPTQYTIEGDWSGASCLLVLRAIAHGDFTIGNLNPQSVQADRAIERAIVMAGDELRGFTFDARDCPDLFPALVALASHCRGASQIIGTKRLTHKESDRAVTLRDEFEKLGIQIDISQPDIMIVHGQTREGWAERSSHEEIVIDAHGDHRIAMATAVAAWDCPNVAVEPRTAVNKSYPAFWHDFDILRAELRRR